jgi:hypothetical protein
MMVMMMAITPSVNASSRPLPIVAIASCYEPVLGVDR